MPCAGLSTQCSLPEQGRFSLPFPVDVVGEAATAAEGRIAHANMRRVAVAAAIRPVTLIGLPLVARCELIMSPTSPRWTDVVVHPSTLGGRGI